MICFQKCSIVTYAVFTLCLLLAQFLNIFFNKQRVVVKCSVTIFESERFIEFIMAFITNKLVDINFFYLSSYEYHYKPDFEYFVFQTYIKNINNYSLISDNIIVDSDTMLYIAVIQ